MLEAELLELAKSGDRNALKNLLEANYKVVYGYLLKLTMNEELTRDLTQETMARAIGNINKFKGGSKFSTWLVSIASNLFKDAMKKKGQNHEDIDEIVNLDAGEDVEEAVLTREMLMGLKKALASIPTEMRQAFILKHYYNYSYEEIASILNCPIGTVRSRIHYSIKKLKSVLDGGISNE
ncbi:sigma-70 family RNA polymerase sigma factor [Pseudobacteroides cellulosolvens]|uniref:RNA polymerase, sigma-24 subunit, RpoE, ECF subfamily n=1 Tax=Pseudobacteroides cellulosolvens ATCC 35603 = DSM 2933 TaxID=398512 RepID=A0A0L6JSV6_9FIRM|nr:sigma-70 family RNA polymerase sigma factor [Pseudobacteroides cellulosolvens]KNY28775.1 RNA polymerase, sigma-24 subunit, RpoE, ECF subfamily [Pseudobacteroides cellulosolvens ATCC 35603 = DSM 2933]